MSEMVAALQMFADHPFLGIGYGNYETHYHRYARDIALDGRREERQAHSLYLEVAAETGVVGLAAFGALIAYAMSSVLRTRAVLFESGRDAQAQTATAFAIALFGYLAGSVFLHLSYPRYFWLLVGVAIAARGTVEAHRAPARIAGRQPALLGSGA
jgi:O-antigen ligase